MKFSTWLESRWLPTEEKIKQRISPLASTLVNIVTDIHAVKDELNISRWDANGLTDIVKHLYERGFIDRKQYVRERRPRTFDQIVKGLPKIIRTLEMLGTEVTNLERITGDDGEWGGSIKRVTESLRDAYTSYQDRHYIW